MILAQSYWLDAARGIKRALFGPTHEQLGGRDFLLAYESRKLRQEEDYAYLLEMARGKRCIFDVGANVGRTALLMSTAINAGGEIVAFEASEEASRIMLENIERNHLSKVILPVNAVVSDISGQTIDFFWDHSSGGSTTIPGYLRHWNPIKKATLSLDDYVLQTNKKPDFVKVDVEGAEEKVLLGMTKILSDIRPLLAIEIHSWESCSLAKNAGRIFSILESAGYSLKEMQSGETVTPDVIPHWAGSRRFVVGVFENVSGSETANSTCNR